MVDIVHSFKPRPKYLVSISTFHRGKLTARNWRIPSLADFMETLNWEQDEFVQMHTMKSNKDHSIFVGVSNQSNGKKKYKDSKEQEKKKQEKPKSSDEGLNPSKDKEKKKQEKTK